MRFPTVFHQPLTIRIGLGPWQWLLLPFGIQPWNLPWQSETPSNWNTSKTHSETFGPAENASHRRQPVQVSRVPVLYVYIQTNNAINNYDNNSSSGTTTTTNNDDIDNVKHNYTKTQARWAQLMNHTIYLINNNDNNNKTYKIINDRIGSECHAPPRGRIESERSAAGGYSY